MSILRFLSPWRSKTGYHPLKNTPEQLSHQHLGKMRGRLVRQMVQKVFSYLFKKIWPSRSAFSRGLNTRKLATTSTVSFGSFGKINLTQEAFDYSTFWKHFPFEGAKEISQGIKNIADSMDNRDVESVMVHIQHLNQLIAIAKDDIVQKEDLTLLVARKNRNDPVITSPIVTSFDPEHPNSTIQLNEYRALGLERVEMTLAGIKQTIGPDHELAKIQSLQQKLKKKEISLQQYKAKTSLKIGELRHKALALAPLARSKNSYCRKQCAAWRQQIDQIIKAWEAFDKATKHE